jgi:hypothetical protein
MEVHDGLPIQIMVDVLKTIGKAKKASDISIENGYIFVAEDAESFSGEGVYLKVKSYNALTLKRGERAAVKLKSGDTVYAGVSPTGEFLVQKNQELNESLFDDKTKNMSKDTVEFQVLNWLMAGERGASSEAMCGHLSGMDKTKNSHPHDPSDFRRCMLLLEAAPLLRNNLKEMAKVSKEWKSLINNWDELEAIYATEKNLKSAPKLYEKMTDILSVSKSVVAKKP